MNEKNESVDIDEEEFNDEDTQKDKYLTFQMDDEVYAIPIYHVVQIIGGIQQITEIPDRNQYEKGVINLRGKIVPVIDVRLRFNLEEIGYTDRTCIVVVSIDEVTAGLIVDEVAEVMDIPEEKIDPPPKSAHDAKNRFIKGMGILDDHVKIILDIEKILSLSSAGDIEASNSNQ